MDRSFDISNWNHVISNSHVEMESSWHADFVNLPPVVSAKFGTRRIKTKSFFFNQGGATKGDDDPAQKSGGLFDPYAASEPTQTQPPSTAAGKLAWREYA
jgi:hypothetical protein